MEMVETGTWRSKPHSRPCMAHLETVTPQDKLPARGGFLIRRGFVRTAAHCAGRSVTVTLGAHTIKKKEDTWPKLEVVKQFPHPKHDATVDHDSMVLRVHILLLQGFAFRSHCPDTVPGAGWRRTTGEESASRTLQEGKLRLVEPQACRHFTAFDYSLQLCMGNPQKAKPALTTRGPLLCSGVSPMDRWMQSPLLSSPGSPRRALDCEGPEGELAWSLGQPEWRPTTGLESVLLPLTLDLPPGPADVPPGP
uniref:Peptidase S1 domain-containing protein n=1 Tax=Sus scrofa TaxID=9823 RepID=A0A8D1UP53_PIG